MNEDEVRRLAREEARKVNEPDGFTWVLVVVALVAFFVIAFLGGYVEIRRG